MGIFSSIGKAIKNVFNGVMKVFQPILEPLNKLMDSALGKIIMVGMSVFTLGTSLMAGGTAFMSSMSTTNSFISSFVKGGKAFMSALTGVGAEEAVGGAANLTAPAGQQVAGAAGAAGAAPEALTAAGGAGTAAADMAAKTMQAGTPGGLLNSAKAASMTQPGSIADSMLAGTNAPSSMSKMAAANNFGTPATAAAEKSGSWLSNAAKAGGEFVRSEGGSNIVGSLIQGAGNYYTEKDRQEFEDRIRRQWSKGDANPGIQSMRDTEARIGRLEAPNAQGIARQSRATARSDPQAGRPQFINPIPQIGS